MGLLSRDYSFRRFSHKFQEECSFVSTDCRRLYSGPNQQYGQLQPVIPMFYGRSLQTAYWGHSQWRHRIAQRCFQSPSEALRAGTADEEVFERGNAFLIWIPYFFELKHGLLFNKLPKFTRRQIEAGCNSTPAVEIHGHYSRPGVYSTVIRFLLGLCSRLVLYKAGIYAKNYDTLCRLVEFYFVFVTTRMQGSVFVLQFGHISTRRIYNTLLRIRNKPNLQCFEYRKRWLIRLQSEFAIFWFQCNVW